MFHLIWGPPGTGKTRVVPEIVSHVSGSVLLGAFTNTALDKMLLSVLDVHPETPFLRMGRSKDSPELARRLGERAPSISAKTWQTLFGVRNNYVAVWIRFRSSLRQRTAGRATPICADVPSK